MKSEPFAVAVALEQGLTRKQLRGMQYNASVWGTRVAGSDLTLEERCRLFAVRMPADAHFSHTTAALLLGAPLPLWAERDERIHITIPAGARAPHARGIRGHQLKVGETDVREVRGLRLSSPARTWCDLATVLTMPDLVAVGDYFLQWRLPLCTREELARMTDNFARRRGTKKMHIAFAYLNDRSESRPESHLRVILAMGGLPEAEVNHVIVDTETGKSVRTDLAFSKFKVLIEYQGDYHRTKAQWRKDMTRRSRLEAQGWFVMEINADDLRDPAELTQRVRRVLLRSGWTR